ncbi:MAG: hypothetical protein IKU61_05505 [Clostridia bacterium]|nr:hypothetical protein [Clostridia bacterium]
MNNNYTPPMATDEIENELVEEGYSENLRPRFSFKQKLFIYFTAWVVLIIGACGIMWSIMMQYEKAQPWYEVEEYIATSGQAAFFTALNKAYGNSVNKYESLYNIASNLSTKYSGKISYKKVVREYTYEAPVYLLCCGNENLLKLTLQRDGETGFMGFVGYDINTVELIAADLLNYSNYALVYPKDAHVKVNGKEFSPTETDRYAVFGSDAYTVCMLENFLERPSVKVMYKNKELKALEGEDFIFDFPEPKLHTVNISVPNNSYVFLDGQRVPSGFIAGSSESEPDRFGQTVTMSNYVIPTVAGAGIATASFGLNQLAGTADGNNFVFSPTTIECTVIAPKEATLFANGNPVKATNNTAVWRSDFYDVANAPRASEYVFTDVYAVPNFTAKIGETELAFTEDEEKKVFLSPASEELEEQYADQVIAFMKAYLYYTTQGYSNTRANLNAVKAHVANPSPLYTNLERSYIGYYYIAPQEMTVEQMDVDNFVPYGDNAFTCDLSYKLILKNWVGEAVDANTMRIAFAKRGNSFLPVNMVLAGE